MTEPFSLISGPDPVAATDRALAWADETGGDEPNTILCLTQSRERADELDQLWQTDHDPLRFTATTLDGYVSQLFEQATGSLAKSSLNKPDRLRLVEAAIERHEPDKGPFAGINRPSNDLADHVQGVFSLLEYAGYASPDAIEHALHCAGTTGDDGLAPDLFASFRTTEDPATDGTLATQARTIAALYTEYEQLREEIHPDWMTDTSEQYLRLLDDEHLVESVSASVDAVVLDGLTRLAPAERETVARIARNVPTVAVVPLVHNSMNAAGIDRGVERALLVYLAIGFELDCQVPDSIEETRLEAIRSLHLSAQGPISCNPAEAGMEWLTPATERDEVRTVARRVRSLIAQDDVAPSDIGVVVTDRMTYRGILSETLGGYDVPFTFTNDIGIEQTLVGDALQALLDLADDNPRSDPLQSLCANALVSFDDVDLDPFSIRRAAADARSGSIDDLVDALQRTDQTAVAEGVTTLVDAVDPAGKTLRDYVAALHETLDSLGVADAVDRYGSPNEATGSHRPAYEKSALEGVEDVLSSLETIAPHVSEDDPVERVQEAVRTELVSGPNQQDGYVRVLPLAEAEMTSFDHLFVLGLTAGHFPIEQDTMAFFGAVNDADEEFSRVHTGRRAHYILGTLLAGSNEVILSTPRHTTDGTEHVPAPVVTELRQSIDGPDEDTHETGGLAPLVSSEDIQREYASWAGLESFESVRRAVDVLETAEGLTADTRASVTRGLTTAWRRSRPEITAHDAQIEDVLEDVYPDGRREPLSPSALEDYARCPFVFLSKRVLGFEEDYGQENDVSRADRGKYVHEVIAEFYRELREREHEPVDLTQYDRETLETVLLEVALDKLTALGDIESPFARRTVIRLLSGLGSSTDNPYYSLADETVADGLFVRFLNEEREACDDAQARATYFEAAVNLDFDGIELLRDTTVEIDTPRGAVEIHGIADRVDVVPGDTRGIFVRDYKTGSTPARDDVTLGTKLQLPLYGLVLETVLEDATGVPHEMLGGSYYRLKSPDDIDPLAGQVSSRDVVGGADGIPLVPPPSQQWRLPFDSREEFRQLVQEVTPTRLGSIATAVENGAFHPTLLSSDQANCDDCSFRQVCDVRHHHQRDTIEQLDETRHYVSERARDTELDLTAYASGGDD